MPSAGGAPWCGSTLTDQPQDRARWWFVNDAGHCALAAHDPGGEPNV